MPAENDPTVMGLIVQLLEENREDVKRLVGKVGDLDTRLARLETGVVSAVSSAPASGALGGIMRSLPAKAGVGVGGFIAVAYAVLQTLQALGVVPPPAAPAAPPPALSAPTQ